LRSDLRPGEFWVQVGEDWVAEEPRPPSMPDEDAPEPQGEEVSSLEIDMGGPESLDPPGTRRWPPTMPPLPSRV
jgi:hypothetical protein